MKAICMSLWFFVYVWVAGVVAEVDLNTFPDVVIIGNTYNLNWTATANYSYAIWLVRADTAGGYNDYDWTKVQGLAAGLKFNTLGGSYDWVVPSNLSTNESYALWLDGLVIPFNGDSYPTMTDWFAVTMSNSSTTPTTTGNAPSSTSSASTGPDSSADLNGSHHRNLSGGAIAGIVIGCLVAIALAIGVIIFYLWHKRRSAFKEREAAARASRLEPVMQESSSAYEMHERAPKV